MVKAGHNLNRCRKKYRPLGRWSIVHFWFFCFICALLIWSEARFICDIKTEKIGPKNQKVDYSSKANSFNVRDLFLLIGTVDSSVLNLVYAKLSLTVALISSHLARLRLLVARNKYYFIFTSPSDVGTPSFRWISHFRYLGQLRYPACAFF